MLQLKLMKISSMLEIMNKFPIFLLLLLFPFNIMAAKNRDIPRFVSTKSDNVNARKGPGASYPINWVLIRKSEPLKVIAEFEDWRKIEDMSGYVGWIHSSLLSTRRSVIIICKNKCNLYKSNSSESRIIAELQQGVRCSLDKVKYGYSRLKCANYKGWIQNNNIWGLLDKEISDG